MKSTAKTKITPYDTAEHLRTPEEIALYLEACLEEAGDDAAFVVHELGIKLRAEAMIDLLRARRRELARAAKLFPY